MRISIIFLLLGFLCFHSSINAQGVSIYGGISVAKNQLQSFTPEGTSHTGYHIGADAKLGDEGFMFIVGLQYHNLGYQATESFSFSHDDNLQFVKGRAGGSFKILKLSKLFEMRLKALASIDYLAKLPQVENSPAFNDATAGAIGGLEFNILAFTLSAEYEYGFFNFINEVDNSSFRTFTLSLGVSF